VRIDSWITLISFLCFSAALVLRPGTIQVLANVLVLLLLSARDFRVLWNVGRARFWIFPILFFVLSPFFIGVRDGALLGAGYSFSQLRLGMIFLLHAYTFVVWIAFVAGRYSSQDILRAAEAAGWPSLGLRIALALMAAKKIRKMLSEMRQMYRSDRPGWGKALRGFPILAGAVVRNSSRLAEEISILFYIRNVRL